MLAQPKPIPAGYVEDRRSVYYGNSIIKDWDGGNTTTKQALTERQKQLTHHKDFHREWSGDRPSPMWLVSHAAQRATASVRLESLAEPKSHHRDFQAERQVKTDVSNAAQNAQASERIVQLANHKGLHDQYEELQTDGHVDQWDWSEWKSGISEAALRCEPNARISQLAEEKTLHRDYKGTRPVEWNVPGAAKKALPSIRVQQLSRPKSRSQYQEDYNSKCWQVSQGAKKAHATPRIESLALPIERKVRQKRGVAK